MQKMFSLVLLVLAFGFLATSAAYSKEGEAVQITVKEFSSKEAEKFLREWEERDKMVSGPTVDVSGTWCFVKRTVSFEDEKKISVKVTMALRQDKDGRVEGDLHNFFFADNEWKAGQEFRFVGKVSENILVGNMLDKKEKVFSKSMFTFKGNTFEGVAINAMDPPDISEVVAVRCSAQ